MTAPTTTAPPSIQAPTLPQPERVRPVVESRPASTPWRREPAAAPVGHPALDLWGSSPDRPGRPVVSPTEVQIVRVRARWVAQPRPELPDAGQWSSSLVLAIVQAMLGQRPVGQLSRWLAEDVLAAVTALHRRRRDDRRRAAAVTLRSVRVQHPQAEAAEVSAHLVVGPRCAAVALRLEAVGDRWLCTALELGPRLG